MLKLLTPHQTNDPDLLQYNFDLISTETALVLEQLNNLGIKIDGFARYSTTFLYNLLYYYRNVIDMQTQLKIEAPSARNIQVLGLPEADSSSDNITRDAFIRPHLKQETPVDYKTLTVYGDAQRGAVNFIPQFKSFPYTAMVEGDMPSKAIDIRITHGHIVNVLRYSGNTCIYEIYKETGQAATMLSSGTLLNESEIVFEPTDAPLVLRLIKKENKKARFHINNLALLHIVQQTEATYVTEPFDFYGKGLLAVKLIGSNLQNAHAKIIYSDDSEADLPAPVNCVSRRLTLSDLSDTVKADGLFDHHKETTVVTGGRNCYLLQEKKAGQHKQYSMHTNLVVTKQATVTVQGTYPTTVFNNTVFHEIKEQTDLPLAPGTYNVRVALPDDHIINLAALVYTEKPLTCPEDTYVTLFSQPLKYITPFVYNRYHTTNLLPYYTVEKNGSDVFIKVPNLQHLYREGDTKQIVLIDTGTSLYRATPAVADEIEQNFYDITIKGETQSVKETIQIKVIFKDNVNQQQAPCLKTMIGYTT